MNRMNCARTAGIANWSVSAILVASCATSPESGRDVTNGTCAFVSPQNLGSAVNSATFDGSPTVSADENTLLFTSERDGQQDLFVSTRRSKQEAWSQPLNLGRQVNDSIGGDFSLRLSVDGKALYFASNRTGGFGKADLYVATRESAQGGWGPAVNLGPVLNTEAFEAFPTPSADGNTLYFNRSTTFDSPDSDIWVTTRANPRHPWRAPQRLEPPINGPRAEFSPSIAPDGLTLYFASEREGNIGLIDIWMTTRGSQSDAWRAPGNLGPSINTAGSMTLAPFISADGRTLYFMAARSITEGATCTPRSCFERLDLYASALTCPAPS